MLYLALTDVLRWTLIQFPASIAPISFAVKHLPKKIALTFGTQLTVMFENLVVLKSNDKLSNISSSLV